jgi:hypothetical protein
MSTTDDESAGFMVSSVSGSVSESGSTATFTLKLTSQPSSTVSIPVSSSDPGEATVSADTDNSSGSYVVFTTSNWNADHVVTVTGVDDNDSDGTQSYVIRLDADNNTSDTVGYRSLDPQDVAMSTTDDESAGFMVSSVSGSVSESGSTATFTLKLTSQPSSTVSIPVSSSDPGEATVSADTDNSSGSYVVFTTSNWNADHVVTVTGVDDNDSDGTQSYVIRLDADNNTSDTVGYRSLDPQDVAMSTTDDESAGFMVSSGERLGE